MLAKQLTRIGLLYHQVSLFGDILLLVKCPEQAAEVFELLRSIAEESNERQWICEAYKKLGVALQQAQKYDMAAKAYKMLVMNAWASGATRTEVEAYRGLAL